MDDDIQLPTNPGNGLRNAALVCAILPFFLSYTTSASSSAEGVVTSTYRNWTAIGGGGLALLLGLGLIPLALRSGSEKNRALGWAGGVLALALYQLVVRSGLVF